MSYFASYLINYKTHYNKQLLKLYVPESKHCFYSFLNAYYFVYSSFMSSVYHLEISIAIHEFKYIFLVSIFFT